MFQRIKLSEGSVIHNDPPLSKILSREDKITSTTEKKFIKRVILHSICFTDRKFWHKLSQISRAIYKSSMALLLAELMHVTRSFCAAVKYFL